MDLLQFLYGLGFVLAGAVCLAGRRRDMRWPDWRWLAVFGLLHGVGEWFRLAYEVLHLAWMDRTADVLLTISAFSLLEALRSQLKPGTRWHQAGAIAHVLVLAALAVWALQGHALEAACEQVLVPGSALAAAIGLAWAGGRHGGHGRIGAQVAAFTLASYGCCEVALELLPTCWEDRLGDLVGVLSGLGLTAGLLVAERHQALPSLNQAVRRRRSRRTLLALLLVAGLFAIGMALAGVAEARERESHDKRVAAALHALASGVTELISRGELGASNLALWPEVQAAVTSSVDADPGLRRRLDAFQAEHRFSLVFLLGSDGVCRASSANGVLDGMLGRSFAFRPYCQQALQGVVNGYWALGVSSGKRGIYAAVPVRNQARTVVGVVVVKQDSDQFDDLVRHQHGSLLLSPEGVVFSAHDPQLMWRAAWPLPEDVRAEMLRTNQYGQRDFPPLVPGFLLADGIEVPEAGGVARVSSAFPGGWRVAVCANQDGIAAARLTVLVMLAVGLFLVATGHGMLTAIDDRAAENEVQGRLLAGVLAGVGEGIATVALPATGNALAWTLANPAAERLLGASDLVGRTLEETQPGWRSDGTLAWLERVFAGADDGSCEAGGGSGRWLRLSATRQDEGLILAIADITDRRRAERERERAQQRVRQVLDATPNPTFVCDADGRIGFVNHAAEALFARPAGELAGLTIAEAVVDAEVAARIEDARVWVSEQGVGFEWEARLTPPRGKPLCLLMAFRPLAQEQGAPHVLVACSDITELRAKEEEVRRTGQFMREVLDHDPNAIQVRDEDGRLVFANRPFLAYIGREAEPEESVLGRPVAELIPRAEDVQRTLAGDRLLFGGGAEIAEEREIADASGQLHWFNVRKRLLPLPSGGRAVLSVSCDVTELKQAVAEAESARSRAEAADRAKSDFLANMSHEIRTPMNGVLGMLELLQGTQGLNPEQREYARTAHRSAEALLGLLNDLLDWSKIEAGRLELERHPLSLSDLLFDSADLFRARLAGGSVELVVDVDPALPHLIEGDPGRLRQILVNLVGNAVKFTREGHVLVRARRAGSRLVLAVEDSGIGIPPDRQGRLFNPFIQADAAIGRHFGGTGLGLAICKRLARLMGGDITLWSEPGRGSRFAVDLPLLPVQGSASPAPPALLAALRVLVVDDNELGRSVAGGQLAGAGCEVALAEDGGSALAALWTAAAEGRPFRCVVSDWRMPGMDGEELARAIRSDPVLGGTTVVMLTAHGQRCDALRAGEAGCGGYLVKPVRGEVLVAVVAEAVGRRERGAAGTGVVTRADVAGCDDEAQVTGSFHIRVLLVEDNQVNQFIAKAMLEHLGATVTVAGDGRQALDLLESDHGYDIVLMDCRMPVMDGFDATAAIRARQDAWGRRPVVIALTANAFDEDRERCLRCGMDDFLTKPVAERALATCLSRWVQR
ncbi:MAG: response regulator [Planctomycetes bacterium]|nr:response regulator [Planctomycetota bacterium]